MSLLIEKYLDESARERDWPRKTVLRKQGELREFLEIVGDRPVNGYSQTEGIKFKDVQMHLPANRQVPPFKGLGLEDQAKLAAELRDGDHGVELLSPLTINDKINTVSLFFEWAAQRYIAVVNPVASLQIGRAKTRRNGKKRYPLTIAELDKMFTAPVYSGARSERHWQETGDLMLRRYAKFWVPLVALFSGMRLGEIIQMQVADVKTLDGITYFDVTPLANVQEANEEVANDDEEKSLKTASSRRAIPVHATLFDIGFGDFLESSVVNQALYGSSLNMKRLKTMAPGRSNFQSTSIASVNPSVSPGAESTSTVLGIMWKTLYAMPRSARKSATPSRGIARAELSREYGSGYYVKTLHEAVQKIWYEGLDLLREVEVLFALGKHSGFQRREIDSLIAPARLYDLGICVCTF